MSAKENLFKTKPEQGYLLEVAWEVCNQVGGIYTVIRSKVPEVIRIFQDRYCLLGPYDNNEVDAYFARIKEDDGSPYYSAYEKLNKMGITCFYGNWLISGKPRVILLDLNSITDKQKEAVKFQLWKDHNVESHHGSDLLNNVIFFGHLVRKASEAVCKEIDALKSTVNVQIHEWMAGSNLPEIIKENKNARVTFTTHATLLGRYMSGNEQNFYEDIQKFDWHKEAKKYNIEPQVIIERYAAQKAHILTTVSDLTAKECKYLLGRKVDIITPNGLNINRFSILHEVHNQHQLYKQKILQFVMGHFFHSYTFDLDQTLFFFTSGRYEFRNKGYDITIEALARLNNKMKQSGIKKQIIMFFITKKPFKYIHPIALQSRAVMEEVRNNCDAISHEVQSKLFTETVSYDKPKLPPLESLVDDYWRLRLRRTLQSWKSTANPMTTTHVLDDYENDDIIKALKKYNLTNKKEDCIKIVYHPDFISPMSPLLPMEYGQFVRGCHLGIFPSYYEPWGYTPIECLASGVPAIASDYTGFGDFVLKNTPEHQENGMYVVNRQGESHETIISQLSNMLFNFVLKSRRERIKMRNRAEDLSESFDWKQFVRYYMEAYSMAHHK